MAGTAMPRGCEKKRNLPGSAVDCPGMRRACVTEAATRYSCARGWHSGAYQECDRTRIALALVITQQTRHAPRTRTHKKLDVLKNNKRKLTFKPFIKTE